MTNTKTQKEKNLRYFKQLDMKRNKERNEKMAPKLRSWRYKNLRGIN